MSRQGENNGASINRRDLLRKTGGVGGTLAAVGAVSQPASAEKQPDGPRVTSVHEGFRATDDAMFEDLSERGFIDEPTVDALDIQQTARGPKDDESYANTITYTVEGGSYTAVETKVSTESETAHVTVFPETGQSIVSIEDKEGSSGRFEYGDGISLGIIDTTASCEPGTTSCSCTSDSCKCANAQRSYWRKCECSCGTQCWKIWYDCSKTDCQEFPVWC